MLAIGWNVIAVAAVDPLYEDSGTRVILSIVLLVLGVVTYFGLYILLYYAARYEVDCIDLTSEQDKFQTLLHPVLGT